MFITFKKRNITIGIVIAVLTLSVYLNFRTPDDYVIDVATDIDAESEELKSGEAIMVSAEPDYVLEAKNNREVVRSKACELLTKVMKDTDISSDARQNAENSLLGMAEAMDKENECESILASKGFGECVVFVSDDGVNVTISKKDITSADVAKINDVIYSVTKINNIKIIGVG